MRTQLSHRRDAADELAAIAAEDLPAQLREQDRTTWHKHQEFIQLVCLKLNALADQMEQELDAIDTHDGDLLEASRQLSEMQQSFNLQYLALQQDIQADNRQFRLLSNVMDTKHDAAIRVINNIR